MAPSDNHYSYPPSAFSVGQGVAYRGYSIIPSFMSNTSNTAVPQGALTGCKNLPKQQLNSTETSGNADSKKEGKV